MPLDTPPLMEIKAKYILEGIKITLGKECTLKDLLIVQKDQFSDFKKFYNLKTKSIKMIDSMILALIVNYEDIKKEKLHKNINKTLEKIYDNKKKIKIENIVNFLQEEEFNLKYYETYNKYSPSKSDDKYKFFFNLIK